MATLVEQASDIMNQMSIEEMRTFNRILVERINYHFKQKQRIAACSFMEGEKVWWESSKFGRRIEGVITKVCQKNIKVRATDGMLWTVSATFLKKV